MSPSLAALFFIFGLVFGSFLNVCIYRIPLALGEEHEEESAWREMLQSIVAWRSVTQPERSFCPQCGRPIRWYDNIPVLSWFLLGGRCRDCHNPISFRYATVELLAAILFLASYARFGFTPMALKFCLFALLMVALIFTDAAHKLLPDAYTIPGLAAGLVLSLFIPVNDVVSYFARFSRPMPSWRLLSLADAALGAFVGAAFLYGTGLLYWRVRGHEGMGLGDVKLMGMIGSFLGLRLTVLTIFGASILGTIFALLLVPYVWHQRTQRRIARHRESASLARRHAWKSVKLMRYYAMPFGVFLGTMALLSVFLGQKIFDWYWTYYF